MINTSDLPPLQQRYMEICEFGRCLAPMTLANYASSFRCFNRFVATRKGSTEFTFDLMLDFLKYMKNVKGYGKYNIRSRMSLMKIYTQWLFENGEIGEWPFENGIIRIRKPKPNPRPLERDQIAKMLEHTGGPKWWSKTYGERILSHRAIVDRNLTTNLAIKLMLATGMRIGEVTNINLRNILDGGGHIRVLGKGAMNRSVFITNKNLLEEVQLYLAGRTAIRFMHPYFLVNAHSKKLRDKTLAARIRRLRAEIGGEEDFVAHRLRHSTASFMFEKGADTLAIQKLLGHAKIDTTLIYTRVTDEALKRTLREADPLDF